MNGHVYLIGAGCGDFDLITLRGRELLSHCDTVVYDALIDERLLQFAPDAEKICVGKRAGQHSAAQSEINAILIQKAAEGKAVVRLKGGDPFVFGRGGEEILALQAAGIPYSTVPGISSCIAVPELAGIPVTHRMQSRSFHVITGHTADGERDFAKYAALDGTLIFLMGLRALPQITSDLMRSGMPCDTPTAVISEGGTSRQQTVRGTLSDITEKASELPPPAIIVIGETAAFDLSPTYREPLGGVSVTVTGTAVFAERVQTVLRQSGADVYAMPHLQIVRTDEIPPLSGYACIVLTSRNGAEIFIEHLHKTRTDFRSLAGIRFAVIGSGTASVLEQHGIYPDIMPGIFTSEALAETIAAQITGKVLLLRAEQGSPALAEILAVHNIPFDDVRIYDTVPSDIPPCEITTDFLVFGSASGVRQFFAQGFTVSFHTNIICIGEKTASALDGIPAITAQPHTAEGIAAAIMDAQRV